MTALLTLERNLQLEKLCNEILGLDKHIENVVIVNQKGHIIENKVRDDRVTKDLSKQKSEMLFMEFTLQMSMFRDFDDEFGPIKYGFLVREKVSISSFPLDEYIIIVFSNSCVNHGSLYNKITRAIEGCSSIKQVLAG